MNEGQSLKPRELSGSRDRGTLKNAATGLAGKFRILSLAVLGLAAGAQACDADKLNLAEDQCYLDNDPTKPCPLGTGANGTGGSGLDGGAGNGGTGANEGGAAGNGTGGSGLDGGAGTGGNGTGGTGANEGGAAGNGTGGTGLDGGAGQGGNGTGGSGLDGGAGQGGNGTGGSGLDGGAGQGGTAGSGGVSEGGAGTGGNGNGGTGGVSEGGAGAGGDGGGQVGDNCVNHFSCEGNLLCCNDVCVNQTTQNCGECGVVCNGGTPFCIESVGQCTAGCAGQYLDCGDHICRDTYNDNMNCGGCGNVCDAGKTCQTGFCKN